MNDVVDYLLAGDPAIRWQTLRDLTDAAPDAVAQARTLVATEGWGARLLAEQGPGGQWDGGTYRPGWVDENRPFFDAWTSTHFSLQSLMEYGVDPTSPPVRVAVDRVAATVQWEYDGSAYFDGEAESCINGVALAVGAYFGQDSSRIAATLLASQHADGGWNCWSEDEPDEPSSFHSTICALEGLWAVSSSSADITAARLRGEEYLLDRALLWRVETGELVDVRFTLLASPVRWYYDVLRALDYFRLARPERDPRCARAIELLRPKQLPNGMFPLENSHQGPTLFELDDEGQGFPSRWVTLRALRVLRWWDDAAPASL
ncbi:MAG: hypothetical protein ACOH1T_12080 [Microbacteriaceae bacterium]